MKTEDGYELKEGDTCFVGVQDPNGERKFDDKVFSAHYRDELALKNGWDFSIDGLGFDGEVEVIAVWKTKPIKDSQDGK